MSFRAPSRAPYEGLLAAPPHVVADAIHGVIHNTHAWPAISHARPAPSIGGELYGPFDRGKGGPGGWIILDEPELRLGSDIVVPYLAGWRRERMPEMPDGPFFELAPDWACEISLPFTDKVERASKAPVYPREKVRHTWLIDPLMKTLEVFRLDGDSYRLVTTYRGSARVRVEPFDAFELELSSLWTK